MHKKQVAKIKKYKKINPARQWQDGKLSQRERQIVELDSAMRSFPAGSKEREIAASLLMWYMRNKSLTPAQWELAGSLTARCQLTRKALSQEPHYIYAMQAGDLVKIGYARDPAARRAEIQTGNGNEVKIVRTFQCSHNVQTVKNIERRIHKHFKQWRVRGEWFKAELLAHWADDFVMS